uniref:G_PROTEIN_RECEP_F1_2 domain-containing protein n=1 Tax=Panagrellus redivivus TaxID=6233 RepID=A0A7E4V184_PANRE
MNDTSTKYLQRQTPPTISPMTSDSNFSRTTPSWQLQTTTATVNSVVNSTARYFHNNATTATTMFSSTAKTEEVQSSLPEAPPGIALKEPDTAVFTVASIYLVCFVVGICGNASTLTVIFGLGTPQSNRRKSSVPSMSSTGDCFRIYVAALCIVDTLVLLSLPWAIVDSLIGFWIFGTTACKIHHLFGSVGRIASTFLITAMSIDRYLSVAYPQNFGTRSARTTTCVVISLFCLAFAVLLPLLIFAQARSLIIYQGNHTTAGYLTVRVFKCVDGMPTNLLFWFTGSTFFVGYVFPMFVIALFNTCLLLQIRKHQQKLSMRSIIPMKRVTTYIVTIAVFYFACWTPYWVSVVYVSYVDLFESRELRELTNASERTMLILYCAHIFPYVNTAVNWYLYGRLESNLSRTPHSTVCMPAGSTSRNGICPGSSTNNLNARNVNNSRLPLPASSSATDIQHLLAQPQADTIATNEERYLKNDEFWATELDNRSMRKITS